MIYKRKNVKAVRQIRVELMKTRETSISISTVKRRQQAAGLNGVITAI